MPELPEVENTVRDLKPLLVGRRIEGVHIYWPRLIANLSPEAFEQQLVGRQIVNTDRRGKFLLFPLDDGATLILHLRMTGKLFPAESGEDLTKHTHLVFDLDNGQQLRYQDLRKFGRFYLVCDRETVLGKLGPEPLSEAFTPIDLLDAVQARRTAIKTLLLNQQVIAGIGNIYADEALYRAGIHPLRAGNSLTLADCSRLHASIRQTLAEAIREGGSTLGNSALSNYRRPIGVQGHYQRRHKVYQLTGKPCPVCGTPVERIKVAQRSTHFCPHCQPREPLFSPID
jgi:formamidopyrimidine-DNA glycosylase